VNTFATVVESDMRQWLERAVIGLNLCPFAKAVYVKDQVHFAISAATQADDLLQDLERELQNLMAHAPVERDTTLLVAPHCLQDFLDYNDFLGEADRALRRLRLQGVIQIASFHPAYQFAGTSSDDITNFTNRAPYPALHLLREESIDKAVAAIAEPEAIFEQNMRTLQTLGSEGWAALDVGPSDTGRIGK
jgi:uncharacterized protein